MGSNHRSCPITCTHKRRAEACRLGSLAPQHVIRFGPTPDFGIVRTGSTAREANRGPYLEAGRAGSIRGVRFCWRHPARRVLSFLGSPTSQFANVPSRRRGGKVRTNTGRGYLPGVLRLYSGKREMRMIPESGHGFRIRSCATENELPMKPKTML